MIAALVLAGCAGYEYCETGSPDGMAGIAKQTVLWADGLPAKAQTFSAKAEELRDIAEKYIKQLLGETDEPGNVSALSEIPQYHGESYVTVNGNIPVFAEAEKEAQPYEFYSELDELGRCGYCEAKLIPEMMPTEERGAIGEVRPSGWHTVKYEGIDGLYLYNRCHLIGYQLTGENANERNLITGTRHLNVEGMLPWENEVAEYIRRTGGTVLYRVTPVYEGENLVASGVEMEAQSLDSEEICFHIYVFNIQPGISIDYATGESWEG